MWAANKDHCCSCDLPKEATFPGREREGKSAAGSRRSTLARILGASVYEYTSLWPREEALERIHIVIAAPTGSLQQ